MPRNKLKKFDEIKGFKNVLEFPEAIKGKWRDEYFLNEGEVFLELACGKGAYTLGLANIYDDKNFIGVDRKGERIWKGARSALDQGLDNVAFLRVFIEKLDDYFEENEVDEIWITFPDPFPKDRHERRRLTAPHMLEMYSRLLKPGGVLHLKTDSDSLYEYSRDVMEERGELIADIDDLYALENVDEVLKIKTPFELKHLADGRTIKYLALRFK